MKENNTVQLNATKKLVLGLQHTFTMFGATVLVPYLTGVPVNVALFAAGVATLLFHLITKGKVPIFLGSSFAYIAPMIAVTLYYINEGPTQYGSLQDAINTGMDICHRGNRHRRGGQIPVWTRCQSRGGGKDCQTLPACGIWNHHPHHRNHPLSRCHRHGLIQLAHRPVRTCSRPDCQTLL